MNIYVNRMTSKVNDDGDEIITRQINEKNVNGTTKMFLDA